MNSKCYIYKFRHKINLAILMNIKMANPPVGKNEKCLLNGGNLVWTNFDHSNLFQSLIPYFKNQQKNNILQILDVD